MNTSKATVSFFLDKSRPNTDGKCLVKLNIYCKPKKKRYATQLHASPEEWEKINGPKLKNDQLKDIRMQLNAIEKKALEVIEGLNPFSFVAFEEAFFGNAAKQVKDDSLRYWFNQYMTTLRGNGQVGSAVSYSTTLNSLEAYRKGLSIHDITPTFLQAYENAMISKGKSPSTVGIYMRQLRAILNQAIDAKALPLDKYPFKKYQIPAGRNIKKALSTDELERLFNYNPVDENQHKALDYWKFSYLCNGINFADIIELKPANISGSFLHFIRAKTKRTKKKDLRPIKVALTPMALAIIEKYRNIDPANPYLFPILEAGLSPVTCRNRCHRFTKWVNKHMEAIRQDLGIEQKIGTYTARHSFSTMLKRQGVSTEFIKESLGHSSVLVTENYLDSFADDVKVEYANLLTQFNTKK